MRRLAVVVTACAVLAACAPGDDDGDALRVDAAAGPVLFDDSAPVVVRGAEPGAAVKVTATAQDGDGTTWTATSRVTAGDDGTASVPTGPLLAMTADTDATAFVTDEGALDVRYRATSSGHEAGSGEQRRTLLADGVTTLDSDLGADGFLGRLYVPAPGTTPGSAVVVLGGSGGTLGAQEPLAAMLAARGHPALAVGYFGEPGLPSQLEDIPVEQFGAALGWLGSQAGVDPARLVVLGASRGTEAALLTALEYPDRVAGLVLASPTSYLHGGYPDTQEAAWTWQGQPLPHSSSIGVVPTDAESDLDVEAITAPALTVCGTDDQVWPSCASAERIAERSPGRTRTAVVEPDAGHLVDSLVPGYPTASGSVGGLTVGGTVAADAAGRLDAWPQVLAFLDAI